MSATSQDIGQFISIYFLGPLSMTDFSSMTVRIIAKAEETANRNIKNLSGPKVYNSVITPSYVTCWDDLIKYGLTGGNF